MFQESLQLAAALSSIACITAVYSRWLSGANATTVALTFLLVILIVAATTRLWIAATTSLFAMLCFNFFFLPPVGTLAIADPQNWVALFAFLAVSLVASQLSSAASSLAQEALARRDELARLFDLSRDVLLSTDSSEAMAILARFISRRFELDYVAICLPRSGEWDVFEAGALELALDRNQLSLAFAGAEHAREFDSRSRTYAGHRTMAVAGETVRLVPLRLGTRPLGLLAIAGRDIEGATLDALGGVAAIAIERAHFLEERKNAELARRSEELKSALLASLGHDLRTPLTAIRVAAGNLQASWLTDEDRREQSEIVLAEVERLTRLFQNILDMARIDAGAVSASVRWVHPSEILEAARDQVEHTLRQHTIEVSGDPEMLVRVDPRLTAAALAHLLENAAQYSPVQSAIRVAFYLSSDELVMKVRDWGPGISAEELPHLFERFYRGADAKRRASGTGMGLSIARGLLAVEQGRVWAERCSDGGAEFTVAIPTKTKVAEPVPAGIPGRPEQPAEPAK
jgi:two-component system sensor histidine kinase KdpD